MHAKVVAWTGGRKIIFSLFTYRYPKVTADNGITHSRLSSIDIVRVVVIIIQYVSRQRYKISILLLFHDTDVRREIRRPGQRPLSSPGRTTPDDIFEYCEYVYVLTIILCNAEYCWVYRVPWV